MRRFAFNLVPRVPKPCFRNAVQLLQNTDVPECVSNLMATERS